MVAKVEATKIIGTLKRKALENMESQPSQILKELNLANVPDEVAAHLADIPNIKQSIVRHRSKRLPPNPQVLDELKCIPRIYSVTKNGDPFLLYDSRNDMELEDQDFGRIIIFQCKLWTADATFKSSPSVFYQLFTIMGAVKYVHNNEEKTVFLPLIFALLERKLEVAYFKV